MTGSGGNLTAWEGGVGAGTTAGAGEGFGTITGVSAFGEAWTRGTVVVAGLGDDAFQDFAHRQGQALDLTDNVKAHVVFQQIRDVGLEKDAQQPHEPGDFRLRPLPILSAEGIERQVADAEIAALALPSK